MPIRVVRITSRRRWTRRPRHRRPPGNRGLGRIVIAGLLAVAVAIGASIAASLPRAEPSARAGNPVDATPTPIAELPRQSPPNPRIEQPPQPVVTEVGDGSFTVLPPPASASSAVGLAYTVEVEGGTGADSLEFAATVDATLALPQGWISEGFTFRRVAADPGIRVLLASPTTTDVLCAPLRTTGQVSCRNGELVVINLRRWILGADTFGDDLAGYRTYVINHEIGHALGKGHEPCPGPGRPAPIMLQQTLSLDGCTANTTPGQS
ncbi:hypothetical protein HMPREF0063_12856 [Aeromicrobium marinum DSM 15272]|uniref:DUF3152 domain-containing protein n=1 Tax=Aeromicrobium marinum DSM 15272 TaxID=585531 RepID=E2SFP7_9ACTN|nr:DUF3152 domain-containing protein [Aeromicrobium marinum]EFQ82014.1 hypothetical protein HMPREF0063_12856 [Aeromicrobium marinum DSM 15272]